MIYLLSIFKSKYCWFVFGLSLFASYRLAPKQIFQSGYAFLGVAFVVVLALSLTCIIRNIKEKATLTRASKGSFLGLIGSVLGLAGMGALQVCGVNAPVCGATVSVGILSSLFPAVFHNLLSQYAIPFIVVSLGLQVISLHFMKCFKKIVVCGV